MFWLEVESDGVRRSQSVDEQSESEKQKSTGDGQNKKTVITLDTLVQDRPGRSPLHRTADGEHVEVQTGGEGVP